LVEQYIEGAVYSIDGYVDDKGNATFCPAVYYKTGKQIGFDDFFLYQQMTPTILKPESIARVEHIAKESITALCLRSTTVHVELLRSDNDWCVVEVGARAGGYRHELHEMTTGFNHTLNDMLNKAGLKPKLLKKRKGYAVILRFYPKKEGRLEKVGGVKKVKEVVSFEKINVYKSVGDTCKFAKNGGSPVFDLMMFHKDRSELLADIRRVEQMVDITVS